MNELRQPILDYTSPWNLKHVTELFFLSIKGESKQEHLVTYLKSKLVGLNLQFGNREKIQCRAYLHKG